MNYKRTKYSCYYTYVAMSSVFGLPPILFVTFREMYGISYTLLGTLVLINFCTQLSIDLIFSFFAKHFNIAKTIRIMPLITSCGLCVYAFVPMLFPDFAYVGLVVGTVIFSVAAGLCEVLLSPLVAALPSDNPERDMSILHSLYAYGLLAVILVSTVYLWLFGTRNWMFLALFFALLPILSFMLFSISPMPDMNTGAQSTPGAAPRRKHTGLALFTLCIFLGSCAENAMTNWMSGYMEKALGMSKAFGDILGMAAFALLLGTGRSLYAKFGKHIHKVLCIGMIGAAVCYTIAGLSLNPVIGLITCAFTGFCTSMLWPGTLIMMEERMPNAGVVAYALMAAGGDFGGSVAPQLLGVIADKVSESGWAQTFGASFATPIGAEQIGLRTGMLISALFPIAGVFAVIATVRYFRKNNSSDKKTLYADKQEAKQDSGSVQE